MQPAPIPHSEIMKTKPVLKLILSFFSIGNPPPLTKPCPIPTQAMFTNPVPYRNNVPSTGLSVPPPPLIKPSPMNYPVQVRFTDISVRKNSVSKPNMNPAKLYSYTDDTYILYLLPLFIP